MGLAIVEFVMAVEERFGISIPDEDAEKIANPGELVEYVWSRVQQSANAAMVSECFTQRSYHALRRSWMIALRPPRAQFRPETRLDDILPNRDRRQIWEILGSNVGARFWPELECSLKLKIFRWVAPITVLAAINIWMINALHSTPVLTALVGISSAIGTAWVVSAVTRHRKILIPPNCAHVKDLTRFIVARNPQLFKTTNKGWTQEEVRLAVRELVIEHTGVHDFKDDDHFVKDLGLD